jgi:hypothetical protein
MPISFYVLEKTVVVLLLLRLNRLCLHGTASAHSLVIPALYDSFIIHLLSCSSHLEHTAPFGVSVITHTIRQVTGLLWTSDQPDAETSTYAEQHNIQTQQRNIHAPSGIRNRDPRNQATADLSLRPRAHWDRRSI